MKIILFNGPPSSGKDTASDIMFAEIMMNYRESSPVQEKLSLPMKQAFAGMMDLDIIEDNPYEEKKEEIIPLLGVSYRQWQIDFSEKFMKPLYGQDIFARLFLERLKEYPSDSIILVSDCGFQLELDIIAAHFRRNDIALVRLYRDGYTFEGDSRHYVIPSTRMWSFPIGNNGTLEQFKYTLTTQLTPFLDGTL